jgi:hypothetical protein
MFKCLPDDQQIEDLDPLIKIWMFQNWAADQMDQAELAKNHAILLGSFWNPEAAKKMMGDPGNTHVSSDEEFEESIKMVRAPQQTTEGRKRNRKRILN